ncbi:MAG: hypothetical protein QGF74_02910 [Candidatus Nanoarchaeia archaeon]|jgi:translation elongation factor P/translation initiation factor 5A|nr:hypothetical protein [Candidatus Nanoarchaeia archaeon]|tara:strand:- start:26429 stop:26629 length:201 start_codon:yes stop_codon:yes gene_type:complete
MTDKLYKDLKKGDKIIINDEVYLIEKIEFSKVGKLGKSKCRIDSINEKTKESKVIVRVSEDTIKTP